MFDLTFALLLIVILGTVAFYAWHIFSVIGKKPVTGEEALVGAKGIVKSNTLAREGEVSIDGVIWRARLADSSEWELKKGDEIIVKRIEGLILIVEQSAMTDHSELPRLN